MQPALIYFADPMCSWCWGFSPVIERLRVERAQSFEMNLVLGGLAPGTREPLDDYRKDEIRAHWRHVAELSGQIFDQAFFARESFLYNTEPACRAVVAMRRAEPGREFEFLRRLHEAFYAHNRDITNRDTLGDIAAQCGCERTAFLTAFDDPKTGLATGNDFAMTQSAGIKGFPALVVGNEQTGLAAITIGYQNYAAINTALDKWLLLHPTPG